MMGFNRGYQCAELIIVMRALVERSPGWGETVMVARAFDSVRHGAVLAIMWRRHVPEALVAAYSRELRHVGLTFVHMCSGW